MSIDLMYDIMTGRKQWSDLSDDELNDVQRGSLQSTAIAGKFAGVPNIPQAPSYDKNIDKIPDFDPNNPVSAQDVGINVGVQKQPLSVVEGVRPQSYYIDPEKIDRPIAKSLIKETIDPIMGQKEALVKSAREQMLESGKLSDERIQELAGLSKRITDMPSRAFDSSLYNKNMAEQQKKYEEIKDPQRDMMTQAILSLGPALLGGLSGESGQLIAPKVGAAAQAQYEAVRKEDIVHNEKLRDNLSKRIDALAKMKEQDIKLWENQGKQEMELLKNQIMAAKNASKAAFDNKESDRKTYEKEQSLIDNLLVKTSGSLISGESSMLNQKQKQESMEDRLQKRLDVQAHQNTLNKLDRDPNLKQYTANLFNLQQARTKIEDPSIMKNPQTLEDVQQLITRSMGIKGQGSMREREKMDLVAGMIGVKSANLQTALTSKPTAVDPETRSGIISVFKNLLSNERFTTMAVVDPILKRIAAGNESMYERNPDLKQDLMNKLDSYREQFATEVKTPGMKKNVSQKTPISSAPKGMSFEEFKKWKAGQQ